VKASRSAREAIHSRDILIDVIIPVKNDWDRLALVLGALEQQTLDPDVWNVVIVDNASSTAVPTWLSLPANAHMIVERRPGSYAARNAGITMSSAPYIAFTDADCIPDADWLRIGVNQLAEYGGRIAGDIRVFAVGQPPSRAEVHEMIYAFNQRRYVARGVAATANLFVSRTVIERVGLFDDRATSGGDFEWNRRATTAGVPLLFSEDAFVRHPARSTLSELLEKDRRVWSGKLEHCEHPRWLLLLIALHRGLVVPVFAALGVVFGRSPFLDHLHGEHRISLARWILLVRAQILLQRLRIMARK
jgi:glycosyltransferase involved in cell wall biosynthesis